MMENTSEALLQAQRKRNAREDSNSWIDAPAAFAATRDADMEREMMELHLKIESLLPETQKKVIQFIGSRAGEGVSTIVREYAWLMTARLGKTVLIVDEEQDHGGQRNYFHIANNSGQDKRFQEQGAVDPAATRIGESGLYVSCSSLRHSATARIYNPCAIKDFIENSKMRFDIALVDSPPPTTGHDAVVVTRGVDGVILVVEAERTRWPVVENAKNMILGNGGTILGMIFNKRRNYIPEFIYTRLW